MTPDKHAVADIWSQMLAHPQARHALDDLQTFINGMEIAHQAGGWRVYGYMQLKASAIRREKRRAPKAPK